MTNEVTNYNHPSSIDVFSQLPEQTFGTGSFPTEDVPPLSGIAKTVWTADYGTSAPTMKHHKENPLKHIVEQQHKEIEELKLKLSEKKHHRAKWEYCEEHCPNLNSLGEQGWEMCGVKVSAHTGTTAFFFKRRTH